MKVDEYLKKTGLTKAQLSSPLGVSRSAVTQWDDIPEKYDLEGLSKPIEIPLAPKVKPVSKYTLDEIREICKRRGGLEGLSERTLETDYEIAHSLGLRVWEFNHLIERLRNAKSG